MFEELYKYKYTLLLSLLVVMVLIFIKNGNVRMIVENFESGSDTLQTFLNSYDSVDQKFNDVFQKIDANTISLNKSIKTNKNIEGGDLKIKTAKIDNDISAKNIKASKSIAVGKTELTEGLLKKLNSLKNIAGYAVDGGGTTHLLFEGGWYNLNKGIFNAWSNDRWDIIYLFKGWKGFFAEHPNGKGKVGKYTNTKAEVTGHKLRQNKTTSYKIQWVGY